MGGAVCTLSESGRHSLSMGATNLSLLLAYTGDVLVMVALYIKFVLESQVAVVIGNQAGALAYFLLAVGLVQCFVCAASAKATYDAGCQEMATRRTCSILVFTLACQALTLLLLLAAILMCLVHKALIRDLLHTSFLAAIKLYGVHDKVKAGLNRIQAGFQCCGSRSMQDWFRTSWVPMAFLDVDHPDVARRIVNGEFVTDDAPYSCCDVHVGRPCVHHQVQNLSAHRMLGPGGTLYTTGCAQRLEDYWKANVLNPLLGLLLLLVLLMILSMTLSRLLQTSLRHALDKGNPAADGDSYCFTCPCGPISTQDDGDTATVTKVDKGTQGDGGDRQDWGTHHASSHNRSSNRNQSGTSGGPPGLEGGGGTDGQGHPRRDREQQGGRGDGQEFPSAKPVPRPDPKHRGADFNRYKAADRTRHRSSDDSRSGSLHRDCRQQTRHGGQIQGRDYKRDGLQIGEKRKPDRLQNTADRGHDQSQKDKAGKRDQGKPVRDRVRFEDEVNLKKIKMMY